MVDLKKNWIGAFLPPQPYRYKTIYKSMFEKILGIIKRKLSLTFMILLAKAVRGDFKLPLANTKI